MMEAMPFLGYWSHGGIECEHHLKVVLGRKLLPTKWLRLEGDSAEKSLGTGSTEGR